MKFIDPKLTLQKSYIAYESNNEPNTENIFIVSKIISYLEQQNIICETDLILAMMGMNKNDLKMLNEAFEKSFSKKDGVFFRKSFATKADISKETLTLDEFFLQIYTYIKVYGLNEVPDDFLDVVSKRGMSRIVDSEKSAEIKKEVQDKLNNSLNIIKLQSIQDFEKDVKDTLFMPLVFGDTEYSFLASVNNIYPKLMCGFFKSNQTFKVKENLFRLIDLLGSSDKVVEYGLLNTATDILRYALKVSGLEYLRFTEKYNEETPLHFYLKTSHKKLIMKSLDNIGKKQSGKVYWEVFGEMNAKRGYWIALGKNIYAGSRKFSRYKIAQSLFHNIRNGIVGTKYFNQKKEALIRKKDITGLIDLLISKPGVLLRSVDHIIRNSSKDDIKYLCKTISDNSDKFNMKLIMQVKTHLKYRMSEDQKVRPINVPGKKYMGEKLLPKLSSKAKKVITVLDEVFSQQLAGKPLFDMNVQNIFIEPNLSGYIMPTEIRDNSITLDGNRYTTGTRIPLPKEAKVLRLFTAWGNKKENEKFDYDIDLSAMFINNDGKSEIISFQDQSLSYASHSGDWVFCYGWDEKDVVAEFIDIDIEKAAKENDYINTLNILFSGANYEDFDTEVVVQSGVTLLDEYRVAEKVKIDTSTSFFKMQLRGKYQTHMPALIDLKRKEIVIMDVYSKSQPGAVMSNFSTDMATFKTMYSEAINFKENMKNFITVYANSNGLNIVENPEDADIVVSSYDHEKFETFNVGKELNKIVGLLA